MPSVEVNGITIAYEEYGNGPPLLLVMGLGAQLIDWPEGFVELLAERFRVIAFDNRDSGLSSEMTGPVLTPATYLRSLITRRKPQSAYKMSDLAQDADGLLDHLGIDRAHVVGASMGGMIVQTLAIEHPARVQSMVSIMSNTGDGRRGATDPRLLVKLARRSERSADNAVEEAVAVFKLIAGPGHDSGEVERLVKASVARSFRPHGAARQLAAIKASPDRTASLAGLRIPTLVIHGLLDPLVLPSGGTATAKAVPGSSLLMFPDMGHDLPRSRWPEMVDAISANAERT